MRKQYKYIIILLAAIIVLFLAYIIASYVIARSFQKDIQLPDANDAIIDIGNYDTGARFSIENIKEKQELFDLIKSNISLLKLKADDYPFDSEHNTYYIIIQSKDFSFIIYVSNKEPLYCYVMGDKFDYYITGGDVIADYLDKYITNN